MPFQHYICSAVAAIEHEACTKTAVLTQIVRLFKQHIPELDEEQAFNLFWQREQMGSTSLGHGTALPHIRCRDVNKPYCSLMRLSHPIDFGGVDRQPVDLLFALIVPEDQHDTHLCLLKEICELLNQERFRKACRMAQSTNVLHQILNYETIAIE